MPSPWPCGLHMHLELVVAHLQTYTSIFSWRFGCSSTFLGAPAAPHSSVGLMPTRSRHIKVGPHMWPPPGSRQLVEAHRKAAVLQGNVWRCQTRPWLLLFLVPSFLMMQFYFILFFFPADPFFISVCFEVSWFL